MDTVDIGTAAGVAYFVLVLYGLAAKPLLDAWLMKGDTPQATYGAVAAVVLALLCVLVGLLGSVVGLQIIAEKFVTLTIGGWVLSIVGVGAKNGGARASRGLRGL